MNNPQAIAPVFAYSLSAGYELYASENITITSGSRAFVDTGVTIKIPIGMYGNIPPFVNYYTRIETHELTLDPFTEHRLRVFFTNHSNYLSPATGFEEIKHFIQIMKSSDQ